MKNRTLNFIKKNAIFSLSQVVFKYLFQIILLVILIRLLFFTDYSYGDLKLDFSNSIFFVFLLLLLINIISYINFYILLKIFSEKNFNVIEAAKIYFEGGVANSIYIGIGVVYKYYKYLEFMKIRFLDFVFVQATFSLLSFLSYIFLGMIFGSVIIYFYSQEIFIYLLIFSILLTFIFYLLRKKIKAFIKKISMIKVFPFDLFNNFYLILKRMFSYFPQILLVFIINIFLSLTLGFVVFLLLKVFLIDLSYIESLSLYISSILISTITMFNYLGAFEIALAFSGTYYNLLPAQVMLFGFSLRLVNMASQLLILLIIFIFRKLSIFRKKI